MPLADTTVWARLADGLLLVVRGDQTPKWRLQKAMEGLNGHPLLGVVLNEFREKDQQAQAQYCQPQSASEDNKKVEEA
jgi:Mrp family chromosome partitioning ATPase